MISAMCELAPKKGTNMGNTSSKCSHPHGTCSQRLILLFLLATIKPEEEARARFKELMQHRRLVELTKAQVEDINTLRMELEKQRMRTFPVLSDREQET